jgi:hypothetical protein
MAIERTGSMEFTGLKGLEPLEQTIVKGIAQEYLPILERDVHSDIDVLVHVKSYNKGGNRTKYSIHLKLIYAGNVIDVNKVHDWDLPKGVHEAFVALINIAKKKFRNDTSRTVTMRKSQNKSENQVKRRERKISKDKRKQTIRRTVQRKRSRTY